MITLLIILAVAITLYCALTNKKGIPPMNGAALLFAALLCGGCATAPLTHDTIPAGYEQVIQQGKQDALNWFPQRWGEPPKVVPFLCYIPEPAPREGGMWSTGHQVHFWVGQPNKRGSFDHEYRHHLNWNNGHGAGQGTQADEEATR